MTAPRAEVGVGTLSEYLGGERISQKTGEVCIISEVLLTRAHYLLACLPRESCDFQIFRFCVPEYGTVLVLFVED